MHAKQFQCGSYIPEGISGFSGMSACVDAGATCMPAVSPAMAYDIRVVNVCLNHGIHLMHGSPWSSIRNITCDSVAILHMRNCA